MIHLSHKKGIVYVEKNASITEKYLLEQKIRLLNHPACSTDLNPIENLWRLIVAKVYEGGQQYSAIFELKNAILDGWGKIPSVQLQKLVDSMPSQMFEVIKANSGSTKYWIKNLPLYFIVLLIGLIFMSKQNFKINANIHKKKKWTEISSYLKSNCLYTLSFIYLIFIIKF